MTKLNNDWISVKDQLPNEWDECLCFWCDDWNEALLTIVLTYFKGKWRDPWRREFEVDYWMPLPPDPEYMKG